MALSEPEESVPIRLDLGCCLQKDRLRILITLLRALGHGVAASYAQGSRSGKLRVT